MHCCGISCHGVASRFAPSQWEMSLQSNTVSHWLSTNLKSALCQISWIESHNFVDIHVDKCTVYTHCFKEFHTFLMASKLRPRVKVKWSTKPNYSYSVFQQIFKCNKNNKNQGSVLLVLSEGNPAVSYGLPWQRSRNAESFFMPWRLHVREPSVSPQVRKGHQ